jgi:hypothetical protein
MNTSNLARRLQEVEAANAKSLREQLGARMMSPSRRATRRARIQTRDTGLRPFRVV